MRKIASILLLCIGMLSIGFAQEPDANAKAILDKVGKKYQKLDNIKADFNLTIENVQEEYTEEQVGSVTLAGEKFRMTLNDQEVICDNQTIWTHLIEDEEVQINIYEEEENIMSPTEMFKIYETDYFYAYMGMDTYADGKSYQLIELSPNDKDQEYFKIKIWIDKDEKLIYHFKVYEKNGTRYTMDIKEFELNADLPEYYFIFDEEAHPNVDVIDLR